MPAKSQDPNEPTVDDVMICEGSMAPDGADEEEQLKNYCASWQRLIDSGLAWQLGGTMGRAADEMISAGLCKRKNDAATPDSAQ